MEIGAQPLAQSIKFVSTRLREEECPVGVKFSGRHLFYSVACSESTPERPRPRSLYLDLKHGRQDGRKHENKEVKRTRTIHHAVRDHAAVDGGLYFGTV